MAKRRSRVATTFGTHLQTFARSVDIVEDSTIDQIRNMIYEYVLNELDVAIFEVLEEAWVDNDHALRIVWSSADRDFTTTIMGADDKYTSQLAVSFDTGDPMWIVNPEGEPLRSAGSYVDQWSGLADLPPYKPPIPQDLFTSIVVPMRRPGNRILGVVALQSGTYWDFDEDSSRELKLLADSLGVLMDLENLNNVQTQGTRDAIDNLRKLKENVDFPQIAKPKMFFAFSARADQEVVGLLGEVLDEFSNQLDVRQWNRIDDSGTVTTQVAKEITTSRFGICYFSEPEDNPGTFADNPNVLFEAGMLHALTVLPVQEQSGWIPIREKKSPPAPFDFRDQRSVLVPRAADGGLNREMLASDLRARLDSLLSE